MLEAQSKRLNTINWNGLLFTWEVQGPDSGRAPIQEVLKCMRSSPEKPVHATKMIAK